MVKHFTFLCTLSPILKLSHSHTLLVFSPKLSPSWSFSPTYHRQHLRHYPSLAPPFASATHHRLHYHRLYLNVFFSPVILHYCCRLHHFLAPPLSSAYPQVLSSNFFPLYCWVGYWFGFLLNLGQVWLLLWVAIDGWDRLWVVVVVGLWFVVVEDE